MSNKKKIIRTRDIIFNKKLFYNSNISDLTELLQKEIENLMKVVNFLMNSKQNSILSENINLNSDLNKNSDKNDQSANSTTTEKSFIIISESTNSDSSIMLSTSDQTSSSNFTLNTFSDSTLTSQSDSTVQLQTELYIVKSLIQSYMKTHSQPEPDSESHDNKRSITTRQIIDDLSEKNIVENSCQQISTNQQLLTTSKKSTNYQAVYFATLEWLVRIIPRL